MPRRSLTACFTRSAIDDLGEREIRARVIDLLVAHFAVHLQHAVVVLEHVPRDRARERILHVGIDVHLHHAVVERLVDFLLRRARAAVEDEMEARVLAVRLHDRVLALLEHLGPQLHVAGFIDAVDVAKRRREQVAAADRVEAARDFERVLGRRVEFRGVVADDIILLATDRAGFDFEHEVVLRKTREQFLGNLEIFLQREIAPVEHVRGEKIRPARGAALLGFLDEREDKLVEFVLQAVVGVQRDVDGITLRGAMDVLGDRNRAERHVLERRARRKRAAARGDLDDAIGLALGEAAQDGVGGGE